MIKYELPELSTASLLVLTDQTPTRRDSDYIWVRHPDLGVVQLNKRLLVEIKPLLPPIPDALAVAVGDHVFIRDDVDSMPVFICPGSCHRYPLDWPELNELAAKEGVSIVALVPARESPVAPADTTKEEKP